MNEQWRLSASHRNQICYACSCLLALFCIAMPLGSAYGQTLTPDATGTVTCEQISSAGDVSTVAYTVGYYYGTNTVSNRWGDDQDFIYKWGFGFQQLSKRFTTYTVYFHQESTDNFENFYAEAGQWQIRVDKNNAMSITGRSFVVKDVGTPEVSADCAWNLKGTMPTN